MLEVEGCGLAVDEQGHAIGCADCVMAGRCQQSLARCAHRFEINDPDCRICSGVPDWGCKRYEPE